MPTWTSMTNRSAGDTIAEADWDAYQGNLEYLLEPNHDCNITSGSGYTVTGTSFAPLDAALDITLTTYGGPVLLLVTLLANHASSGTGCWDIAVDGTRLGNTNSGLAQTPIDAPQTVTFHAISKPAAGSHTFSIYVKVTAGTLTVYNTNGSTQPALTFTAIEL